MENQRLFLIGAIFFTGFLLWQEWQTKDTKLTPTTNSVKQITQEKSQNNTSINSNDGLPQTFNEYKEEVKNNEFSSNTQSSSPFISIKTDLFTAKISTQGGTIESVYLSNFPVSLEDKENKIQLIKNKEGEVFKIQSGLLPAKILPTHQSIYRSEKLFYDLEGKNKLVVSLLWQENDIKVIKNFTFKRDSYLIDIDYQISNTSNKTITAQSYVRLAKNKPREQSRKMGARIYNGGAIYNEKDKYSKIDFEDFGKVKNTQAVGGWMAMVQHYFLVAVLPNEQKNNRYTNDVFDGLYRLSLVNEAKQIPAKKTVSTDSNKIFIGPKEQARLVKLPEELDRTVDYGFLYIIAKPLSWLLNQIHSFVNSWGWSIILLTVLIKLVFYKLSETSYRSMAGMRKLTPKIQRLKETYGEDKQKLSQKMMALYKEEKINPAAGCLPILVQIPVFISLYWVLLDSVELRQNSFWWLSDLSTQDPYYILPLIMGASMFVQQKLNPQPADPMQAKVMAFLPIIFTIFFLWFPSGLVLYWVVNNVLSIAQQWIITKRIDAT
ncbi:Inner membrane protein translocase component YidC, long form [hydrothermal vent metagenome]|uniref:Membrane protein insertase YidC n=1 Tax=hydrothermal vent metagenome TaxID=652676 RepID=A0A1W1C916_9ZZZZ